MSVETVNESLDRRLVEVPQVGGTLTWFLAKHERLGVDESESINDDLALHRLNGINDDGDGSGCKLFEGLLGIDIDGRQPAAKSGM